MIDYQLPEHFAGAQSSGQFAHLVEQAAQNLTSSLGALYYRVDPSFQFLERRDERLSIDANTQPGACALFRETREDSLPAPGFDSPFGQPRSFPVSHFGELVGVLCLLTSEQPVPPDFEEGFVRQLGLYHRHTSLREEVIGFTELSRDLMVQAVEALGVGKNHIQRVARLSTELASLLDLSCQVKADLFQAAHYHDVGLLALQEQSNVDRRQRHPLAGAEFLRSTGHLQHLAHLLQTHHERYDGSGSPKGLSGDSLPIECWVLVLAEHLDEFWQEHPQATYLENLHKFFCQEADHHHPDVLDALCGLSDSGRLKQILEEGAC